MLKEIVNPIFVFGIIIFYIISPLFVLFAEAGMENTKHDFTFNDELTPNGICSGCHDMRIEESLLWVRDLSEEEAYFNQTSNPNYVK